MSSIEIGQVFALSTVLVLVSSEIRVGQITPGGCTCPGDQLTFECTSFGGIATVWHGNAFNCGYQDGLKLPDEIILIHNRFNSGVEEQCGNNGQIIAQTVGVENNTYFTSILNVTVSPDMNNRTIECDTENSDGSRMKVGKHTMMIATIDSIHLAMVESIHVANVSRGQFVFKWSLSQTASADSISNVTMCPTDYIISSSNCGTCPNFTTNTNATCQTAPQTTQLCTFTVTTRICRSIYENLSSQNITILSKVPEPPEVKSLPRYEGGRLSTITTNLTYNESQRFNFSRDIDGSPISYTVIYSDSTTATVCLRATIPASACERGVCNHIFATSSSRCLPMSDIIVSAFATNLLGDGPGSDPITIVSGSNVTPSNEDGNLILYLVSAITALAVLIIVGVCVATVSALVCLVRRKRHKPKDTDKKASEDVVATYEEIDEFRRISSIIDTSKNMAYIHITGNK